MARLMLNIGYSTQLEITPKLLDALEKCNAYERHWDGNPKYQSIETSVIQNINLLKQF